jgi:hypothetical protein
MTEQDPSATFRLDQEAAEAEELTRDQAVFQLNLRNGEANAFATEAHSMHTCAQAKLLETVAASVALLSTVAALHGLKRLVTRR